MKKVTIYSTPVCHFCNLAKNFFKEHNVAYIEHNVAADMEKRQEMIQISGQLGVPVITIDNDLLVGFNEPKIAALLGITA